MLARVSCDWNNHGLSPFHVFFLFPLAGVSDSTTAHLVWGFWEQIKGEITLIAFLSSFSYLFFGSILSLFIDVFNNLADNEKEQRRW